jgi:fatty-acyl-CoA synthase
MLDLFEQWRGTVMICVPTMLIRMLEEQARASRDLSSWRIVTLGGAPVPPELVRSVEAMIGANVAIGFGQTEASPYLTHTAVKDPHPKWVETVGKPLPQTEVKIVDPATGEIMPLGAAGEICGRGYGIMTGYYNAPDATAAAIDEDGWLRTGDIGSMDEQGYCRVLGRLRDMIIRGGENVYPREVEDILMTHPAVADAAVIGLPDAAWGESVVACIRLRDPAGAEPVDLQTFCRDRLASFKVPKSWHFMASFPQTASGKVQKFALRDQLLNGRAGAG